MPRYFYAWIDGLRYLNRPYKVILFAFLILMSLYWIIYRFNSSKTPSIDASPSIDFEFDSATIFLYTGDHLDWVLDTKKARYYKQDLHLKLHTLRGVFYDSIRQDEIHMVSPLGTFNLDTWVFHLRSPTLEFLTHESVYVRADSLMWDTQRHIILAHEHVQILTPTYQIQSQQLHFNLKSRVFSLDKTPQAVILY